jgi:hypothetical protein
LTAAAIWSLSTRIVKRFVVLLFVERIKGLKCQFWEKLHHISRAIIGSR